MDPGGEDELEQERRDAHHVVEVAKEADAVFQVGRGLFDRPVELQVDDLGHDHGQRQHRRDQPEVARAADRVEATLGRVELAHARRAGDALFAGRAPVVHQVHQGHDDDDDRAGDEQREPRAEVEADEQWGHLAAGDAAEQASRADEAEQALRLPRVEYVVGERPELADRQDEDDRGDDVERDRHPLGVELEQPPEQHHARADHPARGGDQVLPRDAVGEAGVDPQDRVRACGHQEVHDRQPLEPQRVDERRLPHRLGGVLERDEQEEAQEQGAGGEPLAGAHLDAHAAKRTPPARRRDRCRLRRRLRRAHRYSAPLMPCLQTG